MMKKLYVCVAAAGVLSLVGYLASDTVSAWAQSGSRSYPGGSGARTYPGRGSRAVPAQPRRPQSFEAKFWNYLTGSQPAYRNWAPWPGTRADIYPGQSPHGAFLKMYVNRPVAGDPKNLPYGSIIVKENYGKDRTTLMAVTVMYRAKGYDPAHHDWYWIKYNPDGTVARKGNMPIAGRVSTCINCHSGAGGNDFSFSNDAK